MTAPDEHTRIIFLASNPFQDEAPTTPKKEIEAIRQSLEAEGVVRALPLYAHEAATTVDLHWALLRAPNAKILHLYGHGSATDGWYSQDGSAQTIGVSGERLARLLKTFSNIQVLVLSACNQLDHIKALAQHVDVVIGSSTALEIAAARSFNCAFYRELAAGSSVGVAYERAKAFAGIDIGDAAGAICIAARDGTDPYYLRLPTYGAPAPVQAPSAVNRSTEALAQRFDGQDDVVLTANLVGDWKSVVPHRSGAAPLVLDIKTPPEGWQRSYPPDRTVWQAALDETRAQIAVAKQSRRSRVHVATKLPYSLAAVLGSELEQQQRNIMFYQQSTVAQSDDREWQPWGPAFPADRPAQDQAPVLGRPLCPADPNRRTCDVVLAVSLSRAVDIERAQAATRVPIHELQTVQLECLTGVSQTAVNQGNVDMAANEIANGLEEIVRAFPSARGVHVFYTGPAAVLMRAMGRAHLSAVPIIIYEWFAGAPEGPKYLPAINVTHRQLLLP